MNASDDIKAITGIYDPSLGNRSNETSGIAIRERKSESGMPIGRDGKHELNFPLKFNHLEVCRAI